MKILVTGGAGYIGSHTVVELQRAGYRPIIVDNMSNADMSILGKIAEITGARPLFYQADIRDAAALDRVFCENEIEAVIHFAGLKAVAESVSKPLEYYENNVAGTLTLCNIMREHGCKRMVFSSSATVYGLDNTPPYVETMPTSATNPYGWTKVINERILRDICAGDAEWSVLALRYFNPIGAHPSGFIGEEPSGIPNNVFPYLARVAAGKFDIFHITGADYDTRDGTALRDYIHVVDLAEGHLAALRHTLMNTGFDVVNLGTGHSTGVFEMLRAFEKACGHEIPYDIQPRRPGDVPEMSADTKKAKELLGWTAKRDLARMCEDGWRYIDCSSN